jgi:hypothetical protein
MSAPPRTGRAWFPLSKHPTVDGHGRSQPADGVQHRIQQRPRWLRCPCWSTAVRVGANKASCATSAEFGTRLLSDQLSDYRVDDPYIQAHLHGPSSRLVLDLDDSPNVLRDEEVKKSNTRGPACPERAQNESAGSSGRRQRHQRRLHAADAIFAGMPKERFCPDTGSALPSWWILSPVGCSSTWRGTLLFDLAQVPSLLTSFWHAGDTTWPYPLNNSHRSRSILLPYVQEKYATVVHDRQRRDRSRNARIAGSEESA